MGEETKRLCLATVTDPEFLPATLVMIHSFLQHNPWFLEEQGDIVIIQDQLPARLRKLFDGMPNVLFHQADDVLRDKVDALCARVPALKLETRKKRFYSLALFQLEDYRKVLFCDSDILFLGDISELFFPPLCETSQEQPPIMVAGDFYYYSGIPVDAQTFLPEKEPAGHLPESSVLKKTFNAGFLIVDGFYLTPHHYGRLLELLNVERWAKIQARQTDQVVLNLYFKDRCRFLSAKYNYLLLHEKIIRENEKIAPGEIKVIHFNGKIKPWNFLPLMEQTVVSPMFLSFADMWYKTCVQVLSRNNLNRGYLCKKQAT